ncbi:bifunctional hydroxymethylpyrimidine kinase/phosphomethylpyrimidine kinase [Xenorhabdus sp. TH1]|uniref:bifunctional hydroxymethylpyrimidine kinase/phosphomethylpyrimidine kinase n=1 Tax=Xenorhabdus sp. TH1 TaxID=3130166 RepID=UPI0030D0417B
MMRINSLAIAGTDPSGGAGIQADLKTFSALGAYGTTVVTALVAQNTLGVQSVYELDPPFIAAQLESVLSDVRIDSAKIGMLSNAANITVIAKSLQRYPIPYIVLDTVMVAKSGDPLLSLEAISAMVEQLLPNVSLITPNLPEAAAILKCDLADTEEKMLQQGRALRSMGCQAVLLKGGHLDNKESPDWLFTSEGEWRFTAPRVNTRHTHGTGCTLSAALAALRPRYSDWQSTLPIAKKYLQNALIQADSLQVGHGIGPVHHFHQWW